MVLSTSRSCLLVRPGPPGRALTNEKIRLCLGRGPCPSLLLEFSLSPVEGALAEAVVGVGGAVDALGSCTGGGRGEEGRDFLMSDDALRWVASF